MGRYEWNRLTKQQVGTYTEYFVKMELTMFGFQVYSTEVDEQGIDFVARYRTGPFLEIQVKSLRALGYVFMPKHVFSPHENLHLALGLLFEGSAPQLYLIPSVVWRTPDATFVERDYENLQSKPEWGLNISAKNLPALEHYRFDAAVEKLMALEKVPISN